MAGTNLGTAYVTIMPSAKGIKGSISNALSGEASSAGINAGNLFTTALKGILAGAGVAAVGKFFKDALDVGAELQQNLGGTEAVFGQFAKNVQSEAEEAYKNMGLSATDYMATANKMGSLFQGSGLDQSRALELTTSAMQRAADVASVMGIDTSAAMESIAGAAKGNFTMMDNLGVAMNATTIAAYALEKGLDFDWNVASNAEKAEVAMQMFMERTAQYEGNFAKESEQTFSGSLGAMKAAKENLLANMALGQDVQGPLTDLATTTSNFFFNNLIPMIGNVLSSLPTIIGDALTNAFNNLPSMVDSAITFLTNLTQSITDNSGVLTEGVGGLFDAFFTAMTETDWLGLGGAIIGFLWEGIKAAASAIWEGLKSIGETASQKIQEVNWSEVGHNICKFIGDAIGSLGSLIWDGLTSVGQSAKEKFEGVDWAEAGANAFDALVDGIVTIGSNLWEALKTIGETAAEHFKEVDWGQVGMDVLTAIGNGIAAIGGFIWEALSTAATNAITFFQEIDWSEAGHNAVRAIADGITNLATNLWEALTTIGSTAIEQLKGLDWGQLGMDILTAIKDGLVAIGEFFWGALSEIGSMAKDKLLEVDWISGGIDIINGIIDGIKQFGANIGETIKDFCVSAWDKVKEFFGISSPSKLMRNTVGKWIPLGIAAGIRDTAHTVIDAMTDLAKEASMEITPLTNISPMSSIRSGVSSFVNNITISGAENPEEWAERFTRQISLEMRMA